MQLLTVRKRSVSGLFPTRYPARGESAWRSDTPRHATKADTGRSIAVWTAIGNASPATPQRAEPGTTKTPEGTADP
jgi:hypothetical protein